MSLPRKIRRKRSYVCATNLIFFAPLLFPGSIARAQGSPRPEKEDQATAQNQPQSPSQNLDLRRIRILRVTEPIKIDGKLDETTWSQAEAATDFRQREPSEGAPATEKTEVRLLFDERTSTSASRLSTLSRRISMLASWCAMHCS